MPVLIITYDLVAPRRSDQEIFKIIDQFDFAQLSANCFAIDTEKTIQDVFDMLEEFVNEDDFLTIITAYNPFKGYNDPEIIDWLDTHLIP